MKPKTNICNECGASFIPMRSNKFCDRCFMDLSRDMGVDTNHMRIKSVEDEMMERRFK